LGYSSSHIEAKTTGTPGPIDIDKPTVEECLVIIETNAGLNGSRHAPGTGQGTVTSDMPQDLPAGPQEWRDKLPNRQRPSRQSGNTKCIPPKKTDQLERLEA
jgi:hypothetical protein